MTILSALSAEEVTNLYLYGSIAKPADLLDESIIRPANTGPTQVTVDVNAYMDTGPGRFASPAFFDLIQLFFSPTTSGLAPGTYTEEQLATILGVGQRVISLQQWAYDDGKDDYAERVYIWNSVAFEIDDSARFVIEPDGSRYIENFAIIPFSRSGTENFDFESNDWVAALGNSFLEEIVDPSGIGRKVEIDFSPNRNKTTFYYSDYQLAASTAVMANPLLLATLPGEIAALTDRLFQNGSTQFLAGEKPILYGTDQDDYITGTVSVTGVDIADHRQLEAFVGNGIAYVAGGGNDTVYGGEGNDLLCGGTGIDILYGGGGVDTYNYRSGDQGDIIRDSDGLGSIVFDGVTLTGGIQVSGSAGAGGVYQSTDGVFSYLHDTATRSTLIWKTGQEGGGDWIWIDGSALPAGVTAPLGLTFTEASPVQYANTLWGDANPAAPDDTLTGTGANDEIYGLTGHDRLEGGAGADRLDGGAGSDFLDGGVGVDLVLGGAGVDYLTGGAGADTYWFNLGDGVDIIWEEGATGQDALHFGPGIGPADIGIAQRGGHLVLWHANGTDSVTVMNWYAGAQCVGWADEGGPTSTFLSKATSRTGIAVGGGGRGIHPTHGLSCSMRHDTWQSQR